MTDSVATEQKKSRRGLLALVGAGGAVAVAALLGKGGSAEANPGDNFILGVNTNYGGTAETYLGASRSGAALYIRNTSSDGGAIGIAGQSDGGSAGIRGIGAGDSGVGVHGETTAANATGVKGYSNLGTGVKGESEASGSPWDLAGVHGTSTAGTGVLGQSGDFIGVHGTSDNSDGVRGDAAGSGAGVAGVSSDGTGVHGTSENFDGVRGDAAGSGAAGVAGISSGGIGVRGSGGMGVYGGASDGGFGVYGHSPSNTGVYGTSDSGTGVKGVGKPGVHGVCYRDGGAGVRGDGQAPGSVGVFAKNTPGRQALRTEGQVEMDCARKVTLSNRTNTVTLPTGVKAGSNAIVLAMVQGAPGNEAFVRRAFRVDNTHIRITFDKKPANPTAVGYWVVQTG